MTGKDDSSIFFFFQAEDGIRDYKVTGVQTCALPIYLRSLPPRAGLPTGHERMAARGPGALPRRSHRRPGERAAGTHEAAARGEFRQAHRARVGVTHEGPGEGLVGIRRHLTVRVSGLPAALAPARPRGPRVRAG